MEIYSPTGKVEELSKYLYGEMKAFGFEAGLDSVGNVVGRIRGEKPLILLCGHMDTVPGRIPVHVEDGVLYGRGSVDAKAPLAAMVIAAYQLKEEGYRGALLIVGVVDEEGKGKGVKHVADTMVDVDYAVFGEPTDVDTITIGYRGSILLKIVCETDTGHSSAPWLFENSIEKALEIWSLIKSLRMPEEKPGSRFHSLSSCLERIKGGVEGSVVPPFCEIHVGVRIPPSLTVEEVLAGIVEIIETYKDQNPDVRVEIEVEDSTEPYVADSRSDLVRGFSHAIWKIRGKRVKLVSKTGTGDMNVFGSLTGIPVVTYGPGDPHLDHTPLEHVSLNDYLDGVKVIKEAVKKVYGFARLEVDL